ncbi:SDR family oxidoreductase [bacterium SCSIO 12643]|nr:SDR family oxidoreductase [bacterium SCSIO 12643]
MKILLTGATGYIGKRLLPELIKKGHEVICAVRDLDRFNPPQSLQPHIKIIQIDLLQIHTLQRIPKDIDGAYYLVHSMSTSTDYEALEMQSAENFRTCIEQTSAQHVIYLSGITNEQTLSKHLNSRRNVEEELAKGNYHFTTFRAGIIIGSGSASFEIIRDLVEKLPVMITPKWLRTKCQPIGIRDVIQILSDSIFHENTYDQNFDIGGPDILSYKEMLLGYAKSRNLQRKIFIVPVMTPRLSSYWLFFVTSTSYKLALALVDSMKIEVICKDQRIYDILNFEPLSYVESLERTLSRIQRNNVVSSWKDSQISGRLRFNISEFIQVPEFGCFKDHRQKETQNVSKTIDKIWAIGGENGWYYVNFLWKLRGFFDRLVGGVGLRRGRTHLNDIQPGDALDFWRVLYADKTEGRLLLFAEMKLPGEAWLEFRMQNNTLIQTATFRPKGVWGRLYWYSVLPFHAIVFQGMLHQLTEAK